MNSFERLDSNIVESMNDYYSCFDWMKNMQEGSVMYKPKQSQKVKTKMRNKRNKKNKGRK